MKVIFMRDREIIINIDKLVEAIFAGIPSLDITMSPKQRQTYHSYIRIMNEFGWPAYNDSDFEFHKQIVELYETGQSEKIDSAIYDHYDTAYLQQLQESMEDTPLINSDRLPGLKEAFALYNLGLYRGCVALLITQIGGIVKDIEQELLKNNIHFDPHNEKLLESQCIASKGSEKWKVIMTLLEVGKYNDEEGESEYSIEYFRSIIFKNHLKGDDLFHHTNRHMVVHGEQLTFGSKEQALKLILCIEILYDTADVLYSELIDCA